VSEQVTAAPESPPPSFENFMDREISTALKANPKMPSLVKDAPAAEAPVPAQTETAAVKIPETTPEQAAKALLPDFSKLAFGQPVEKTQETSVTPDSPEKKEQSAPAETGHEFPEKFPGTATPQAQDTWAKMRTSVQALWKQNADLTSKLKDAEGRLKEFDGKTPMASEEYDRLTNERDTLVKELRLVKLEATPEYQRAVAKPMQTIEDEIKRLGTKYGVSQHQIRGALTEPDRDKQGDLLSRATETFNDRDKISLMRLADDAKEIMRRRSVLQQDVKQALDYIEAKRVADAEKAKGERVMEWNSSQKKAWSEIGRDVYLARPMEGNDEWNRSLEESKALVANANWETMSSIDQNKILVQAAILPRALSTIHQLWNMYQEAAQALKRYQGVTPGAGSGASSGGETNGQTTPSGSHEADMSFIDAIEAKIAGRR
jgi:hypothetical protein